MFGTAEIQNCGTVGCWFRCGIFPFSFIFSCLWLADFNQTTSDWWCVCKSSITAIGSATMMMTMMMADGYGILAYSLFSFRLNNNFTSSVGFRSIRIAFGNEQNCGQNNNFTSSVDTNACRPPYIFASTLEHDVSKRSAYDEIFTYHSQPEYDHVQCENLNQIWCVPYNAFLKH